MYIKGQMASNTESQWDVTNFQRCTVTCLSILKVENPKYKSKSKQTWWLFTLKQNYCNNQTTSLRLYSWGAMLITWIQMNPSWTAKDVSTEDCVIPLGQCHFQRNQYKLYYGFLENHTRKITLSDYTLNFLNDLKLTARYLRKQMTVHITQFQSWRVTLML